MTTTSIEKTINSSSIVTSLSTTNIVENPIPDFNTNAMAFRNKTTIELIRAAILFGFCTHLPALVYHAETILQYSYRIFGTTITNHLVRLSFYEQFCAGADVASMEPTIQQLQNDGIASIFDFAAEQLQDHNRNHNSSSRINDDSKEYSNAAMNPDMEYELNLERFQQSIRLAALLVPLPTSMDGTSSYATISSNSRNCVAIKVTGLVDAAVLARTSQIATTLCSHGRRNDERDIFDIMINSNETLSEQDIAALRHLQERCLRLSDTAKACGIQLLFDAEQVRYQPAIDALVLHLQRVYNSVENSDHPIIYNTYQCYLKDSTQRLRFDLETSKRHQYHMGIKLVRGAYMESERYLAEKTGQPSPIHDTLNDTHDSFHSAIELALGHAAQEQHQQQEKDKSSCGEIRSIELMCATHNQTSIEYAIRTMNALNIDRASKCISFAQLFGMKDNLTYNLGLHGYRAYKYVPYGDVTMVTPYLLRRAMENSAIRGGVKDELEMILKELRRRSIF